MKLLSVRTPKCPDAQHSTRYMLRCGCTAVISYLLAIILLHRASALKYHRDTSWARRNSVSMCLAMKDQAGDVGEWLDYHIQLGVSRVYVLDNNSTDALEDVLQPYIAKGLVYHEVFVYDYDPQTEAYRRCLSLAKGKSAWLGFIDTDEFIVIPTHKTLGQALAPWRAYGGLVLNWRCLGSSGHIERPPGGVLQNYWKCFDEDHDNNRHIKTFVVPHRAEKPLGAHHWAYKSPFYAVNTRNKLTDSPFSESIDFSQIFVYHYVTKSMQDFQAKMVRGAGYPNPPKDMAFIEAVDAQATANCTALLKWNQSIADDGSMRL